MAIASSLESVFSQRAGENNPRVWAVFKELIYRHDILIRVRRREILWRCLFLLGCIISLSIVLLLIPSNNDSQLVPLWFCPLVLGYDGLVFHRFRKAQRAMQKAMVNFGVIRHHLIGVVELELCQCKGSCNCKEEFRQEALHIFGISLYQ